MTIEQTYQIFQNEKKQNSLIVITILLLVFATIGTDFLFARFQNISFYISESLLFSSYWLLYLPLLNIQWKLAKQTEKLSFAFLIPSFTTTIHLLSYPLMVWLLSKCFYYHTFSYWQIFEFGLISYSIITFIIYALSLLIKPISKNKILTDAITIEEDEAPTPGFITSIIVSDSNNKKTAIATNEILYFSASSPYVNAHHPTKKYLHSETLKSLETQLDNYQFIRIHKSYIVNICKVVCYQSRLNGDYDLTLSDDTTLRVSRNYATVFKARFEERHRLAAK